ncbi:hypothetical protein CEP53_002357 [Fusarium sp. AF-6]|nr:hypothetical protein CEP53_002357 [Fusarium sp. AF-6]
MVDVIGTLSAATTAIEQSVKLIHWVKQAINSPKDLAQLIERHSEEIFSTSVVVQSVQSESALQSSRIERSLRSVVTATSKLNDRLETIRVDLERHSGTTQVARALLLGSDGEDTIQPFVAALKSAKEDLSLHLILANIAQTDDVESIVKVNSDKLLELQEAVEKLGISNTNQFNELIESRPRTAEGYIMISQDDLKDLLESSMGPIPSSESSATPGNTSSRPKKVVSGNDGGDGVQLNAPVAEQDPWNEADVYIMGNKLSHLGPGFNYNKEHVSGL